MKNYDLIREFIKIEKRENEIVILVCLVEWESSYEPLLKWKLAKALETNLLESEVDLQVNKILNDKQYFRICTECGECKQVGRTIMLQGKSLCHRCAERNLGVVF